MPRVSFYKDGKFVPKSEFYMNSEPPEPPEPSGPPCPSPVEDHNKRFSSPTKFRTVPKQPPSNVKADHRAAKNARLARASPVPRQLDEDV